MLCIGAHQTRGFSYLHVPLAFSCAIPSIASVSIKAPLRGDPAGRSIFRGSICRAFELMAAGGGVDSQLPGRGEEIRLISPDCSFVWTFACALGVVRPTRNRFLQAATR